MFNVAIQNSPYLFKAALITLQMAAWTIAGSLLLGAILGTYAAIGGVIVRKILAVYVFAIRGIPVLVLIFIAYFGLPRLGLNITNQLAATIALIVYFAAFTTDIVRGAILAVPRTTVEAGKAIGLRPLQIVLHIQLPLAIRMALPPLVTNAAIAVKSTSYASIVGVWELTYASREVVERTLATFQIFFSVMLIYFCICYPISVFAAQLQRRMASR